MTDYNFKEGEIILVSDEEYGFTLGIFIKEKKNDLYKYVCVDRNFHEAYLETGEIVGVQVWRYAKPLPQNPELPEGAVDIIKEVEKIEKILKNIEAETFIPKVGELVFVRDKFEESWNEYVYLGSIPGAHPIYIVTNDKGFQDYKEGKHVVLQGYKYMQKFFDLPIEKIKLVTEGLRNYILRRNHLK
jgi:hypothetical protein